MASVRKYKTASGTAWRVQYRSPDGRSRTKQGFPTKAKAESWAAANTTQIDAGAWIDPNAGKVTVRQLSELWWAGRQHLKPSTLAADRHRLNGTVLPQWGERQASSIRPSEIQGWLSTMDKAPSTIRQFHGILAGVLDVAVQDGLIPVNPARNIRLPRRSTPVKAYLTVDQLGALAAQAGEHGTLVWVLGTVGLRWGEAVGLQVGDVDFERGRIRVQRNAVQLNQGFVIGAPKSGKTREVAVPLPVLRRLRKEVEGKSSTCWVFEAVGGGPLRKSSTRTGWFAAAVTACQSADSTFPRLTPHGLRHVAAGLMVSSGANVKVVQRQLGHASAAMTLDTYADLFDGDLDGVAVAMGESLKNVVGLSWDGGLRAV